LIEFLELLSVCCAGKSDIAELRCQNDILNLENSDFIIFNCGKMWPLKKSVVDYVLHTFLDSGDKKLMHQTRDPVGYEQVWSIAQTLLEDLKIIQRESQNAIFHFPHGFEVSLRDSGIDAAVNSILPFFIALIKRYSSRSYHEPGEKLDILTHTDVVKELVQTVCGLFGQLERSV
jgi:hypothetical protein